MFQVVRTSIVWMMHQVIIKRQLCQSYNVMLVFDNVKLVVYLRSCVKMVKQNLNNYVNITKFCFTTLG